MDNFLGKWKLTESKNFDEYLSAIGLLISFLIYYFFDYYFTLVFVSTIFI